MPGLCLDHLASSGAKNDSDSNAQCDRAGNKYPEHGQANQKNRHAPDRENKPGESRAHREFVHRDAGMRAILFHAQQLIWQEATTSPHLVLGGTLDLARGRLAKAAVPTWLGVIL